MSKQTNVVLTMAALAVVAIVSVSFAPLAYFMGSVGFICIIGFITMQVDLDTEDLKESMGDQAPLWVDNVSYSVSIVAYLCGSHWIIATIWFVLWICDYGVRKEVEDE